MNVALPNRLTVDEFLAWSEPLPREAGRFELLDGKVIVQQSQRWIHAKLKFRVASAFERLISESNLPYFAAGEGPTVRVAKDTAFEPDALIAPLPEPDRNSLEIPNPVVVVEVLSPSTRKMDLTVKSERYFGVESIQHLLIVDPDDESILQISRDGTRQTRQDGALQLSPPGIALDVRALFGAGS